MGCSRFVPLLTAALLLGSSLDAPAQGDRSRDCRLTMHARKVLIQDAALAALTHVGVSVRSGVATLWGSVPTAELARRAQERVRQVPGIAEVHSELYVEAAGDPLVEFLRKRPARSGNSDPLWFLAHRPATVPEPPPRDDGHSLSKGITLMPPLMVGPPRTEPSPGSGSLIDRIRQLQDREPRFRPIQVTVDGGTVRLDRATARGEDLFDLAQQVARLPEVERVVIAGPR